MGMLGWIFGILGGLCAVEGVITAVEVVPELAGLTWMFWMVLSAVLLLICIAFAIGNTPME